MAKGVFFALRLFSPPTGKTSDHITLRYFAKLAAPDFIHDVGLYFMNFIPEKINWNGYAAWKVGDTYYGVALVDTFLYPSGIWRYCNTPHMTLLTSNAPIDVRYNDHMEPFTADKLWLGRSIGDGEYDWFEFTGDKKATLEWIKNEQEERA